MKVLIVGAGAQGGPCASALTRDSDTCVISISTWPIKLRKK